MTRCPKVSILIPSYNHADFLSECLESVMAQTFSDFEVVIVDDGSTDGSREKLSALADPRVKTHFNGSNMGTYGTLNRALELSHGELIAVLNSDDVWSPTKLAQQVARLEHEPESSFCYVRGRRVGNAELSEDVHADWPVEPTQDLLPYLLVENRVLASGVLFRSKIVRFEPRLRYCGDWLALLEAAQLGQASYIDEPLTLWRQHANNSYVRSPRVTAEEISVRVAICKSEGALLAAKSEVERIRSGLSRNAMNLAALYVLIGKRKLANQMMRSAVRLAPRDPLVLRRRLLVSLPLSISRQRLWRLEGNLMEITHDFLPESLSILPKAGFEKKTSENA